MNSTDLYKLPKDVLILLISTIQEDLQFKLDEVKKELEIYKKVYGEPYKTFCAAPNCAHYEIVGDNSNSNTFTSTGQRQFSICIACGETFCKEHKKEYLRWEGIGRKCKKH